MVIIHTLEFLTDSHKANGEVFDGDANDGSNLFVGQILEPEQDDGSIEWPEQLDATAQHLYLPRIFLVIGGQKIVVLQLEGDIVEIYATNFRLSSKTSRKYRYVMFMLCLSYVYVMYILC